MQSFVTIQALSRANHWRPRSSGSGQPTSLSCCPSCPTSHTLQSCAVPCWVWRHSSGPSITWRDVPAERIWRSQSLGTTGGNGRLRAITLILDTWQGRVQLWVCVVKACLCLREKWSDKVVLLSTNHLCLFCWTPTNSLSVVCPELETSLVCNSNTLRHCWLRLCWATTCQPAWSCRPSPHWTDLTPGGGSLGRSP